MPAIGITGGISTGKSTFCDCLRDLLRGAIFFNADQAVRTVSELLEVMRFIVDVETLPVCGSTRGSFCKK
jgi:dephospho-CoA kinase